jgi:cyclohexanone monooxygenase
MVFMIESQIEYLLGALRTMRDRGVTSLDVREDVVASEADEIDQRMERTVWNTGCKSWYLDDNGRNSTLWPDWTWRFRQRTARFDADSYVHHAPSPREATLVTA